MSKQKYRLTTQTYYGIQTKSCSCVCAYFTHPHTVLPGARTPRGPSSIRDTAKTSYACRIKKANSSHHNIHVPLSTFINQPSIPKTAATAVDTRDRRLKQKLRNPVHLHHPLSLAIFNATEGKANILRDVHNAPTHQNTQQ